VAIDDGSFHEHFLEELLGELGRVGKRPVDRLVKALDAVRREPDLAVAGAAPAKVLDVRENDPDR
jgi:hypothetical protein